MITKSITVKGAVQGVGYRPFIAETATKYGLKGYVYNSGASVGIVAVGEEKDLDAFISHISTTGPAGAFVLSLDVDEPSEKELIVVKGYDDFQIIESRTLDLSSELPVFLPDIGICPKCMKEMLDKDNRRYRYPLISCAVCGPRMSILNFLPYDRNTTTMEDFEMCDSCKAEYKRGRRRYAQTISCHDCGPQMIFKELISEKGEQYLEKEDAIQRAITLLRDDKIIGLKGISGYQLICKPSEEAAKRLRSIKGRENKPFAIMFSTMDAITDHAYVSELERELLTSSARPIVLLNKKTDFPFEVVKKSRYIGAFLPSAGIHRLLTDELGPLIVTSANRSDEPMITEDNIFFDTFMNAERHDLNSAVDGVLYHQRRINMAQDDSVMFVISDGKKEYPQFIRRARGFSPLPIILSSSEIDNSALSVLALGGDLKSCFAFGKKDRILPSQHIGDLKGYDNFTNYDRLLEDYKRIFSFEPDILIKDAHPLYFLTQKASDLLKKEQIEVVDLQHHFAHIYSVMAEEGLTEAIGISFDGTGFGLDGKIWGGEFLYCSKNKQERMGHLDYVKLMGGDEGAKNAENIAVCYRYACEERGLLPKDHETKKEHSLVKAALSNNINTFDTSSMGRLFDAISALLGICSYNSYEGECAIMLENEAWDFYLSQKGEDYPSFDFKIKQVNDCLILDQISLFADICRCFDEGVFGKKAIAYGFHMTVKNLIVNVCEAIRNKSGRLVVCLSGGVFNNRLLLSETVASLKEKNFVVYWNKKVPLGDGGISTGQAYFGLICDWKEIGE